MRTYYRQLQLWHYYSVRKGIVDVDQLPDSIKVYVLAVGCND
jgi:hypothetical protein